MKTNEIEETIGYLDLDNDLLALGRIIKDWLLIPLVSDRFHATRSH